MSKKIYFILSFILVLSIGLFASLPANAGDGEIVSMRTETSKTFATGYKSYRLEVYSGAIHYKNNYNDPNEAWKDIDLKWVNNKITTAPYILEFRPSTYGLTFIDKKTGDSADLVLSSAGGIAPNKVMPIVSGNTIIIKDVFIDTDIEIYASNGQVQFKRILKSNKAPTSSTFAMTQSGDSVRLTTAARYVDKHGLIDDKIPVVVSKNGILITESIDKSKVVKYPIEIDPTLDTEGSGSDGSVYAVNATYATAHNAASGTARAAADTTWYVQNTKYTNYYIERAWLYFDTSSLGATATVTNVVLKLWENGTGQEKNAGQNTLHVVEGVQADPYVTTTYGDHLSKTTSGGSCTWAARGVGAYSQITFNATGEGWINLTGTTLLCMRVDGDINSNTPTDFNQWWIDSQNHGTASHRPRLVVDYTLPAPAVTTAAASSVEATTAQLNGEVTAINDTSIVAWGFVWDTASHGDPGDTEPPATYSDNYTYTGSTGLGVFNYSGATFNTGTTYYYRAFAQNNNLNWGYGGEESFLTKPAPPTNVSATDGADTSKVVVTWTKSFGATDYQVYRDGAGLGWAGDVATYDDNGADAPTITAGVATASDGTSTTHVTLSVAGESANVGTTHTYKVRAKNATGESGDSATDTGYRGVGALTYEWFRSAADADAGFASIAGEGGTTDPYNDTNAPADGSGRWYYCHLTATGATVQDTNHDRGYRAVPATVTTTSCTGSTKYEAVVNGIMVNDNGFTVTEYGFDYGLTVAYGSAQTLGRTLNDGDNFRLNLQSLLPATIYHFRAKVLTTSGVWGYGSDMVFITEGSPVLYEYLNTGYDGDSSTICSDNWSYMQFTVGNISHTATNVNLYLKRLGNPSTATLSIKHASGGAPTGNDLVSTTFNGNSLSTGYSWYSFDIDETILEADQQYAIVLRVLGGDATNYIQWGVDSGGSLANAVYGYSTNGGLTWTSGMPTDALFEIWGNPAIDVKGAKVFTGYLETGDWLMVADTYNVYEPYYPNGDPQTKFQLQFLQGTTIYGSNNMKDWGRQPLAIYFNAAKAATLGWSDNTTVLRIQSLDDAGVYQEYGMLSSDWQAGSLYFLDGYVLNLAQIYQDYYNEAYLTAVAGKGKVLNDYGGMVFQRGIQLLATVRPNLFANAEEILSHTAKTFTHAGETGFVWSDRTGSDVASFLTGGAEIMSGGNVGAKDWGGYILVALWLLSAIMLGVGHFTGGAISGLGFIGIGMLFGLIPWAIILATAALGVIFIMMYMFLRSEG